MDLKDLDLIAFTALNEARDRVTLQVLSANSLPEIEVAKQVLRDWLKAHPDEQGMRDGFEQLCTIQEIIKDENARNAAGEIIPPVPSERERILLQAADACTLTEKQWAAHELWEWQRRNLEDADIREARKGLPCIDDFAEEQEVEHTRENRLPVEARQAA